MQKITAIGTDNPINITTVMESVFDMLV